MEEKRSSSKVFFLPTLFGCERGGHGAGAAWHRIISLKGLPLREIPLIFLLLFFNILKILFIEIFALILIVRVKRINKYVTEAIKIKVMSNIPHKMSN